MQTSYDNVSSLEGGCFLAAARSQFPMSTKKMVEKLDIPVIPPSKTPNVNLALHYPRASFFFI